MRLWGWRIDITYISDMEGLLGAQNVDCNKLRERADKLGMRGRLEEKLKLLGAVR